MDAAPATPRPAARSSWLFGCAAIAATALLIGVTVAFHGPMTFRPLGVRVQMGDAMRPFALATIADVALFALAFRRRAWRRTASILALRSWPDRPGGRACGGAGVSGFRQRVIELATINALEGGSSTDPIPATDAASGSNAVLLLAPF